MFERPIMTKFVQLIFFVTGLALIAGSAHAKIELDITKGNVEPLPIAISDFAGGQVATR